MIYSQEVEMMCPVAQGANHGPAPIHPGGSRLDYRMFRNDTFSSYGF